VVLINKDLNTSALVQLQIPGPQIAASAESLSAPSVTATSGVSIGGQTFGADTVTGTLPGNPSTVTVSPSSQGAPYSVQLPPASAIMLTR
jgi:hypothetical protein